MAFHLIPQVLAQNPAVNSIVGEVTNPLNKYGNVDGSGGSGGLVGLFSNVLRLVFVVAGIYALINFITAGYTYMSAGGDSKQLTKAWEQIWQSLWGLVVIVVSFALAAIFGQLIFGRADFILNPMIYGPGAI